jgi:hypothetical protein
MMRRRPGKPREMRSDLPSQVTSVKTTTSATRASVRSRGIADETYSRDARPAASDVTAAARLAGLVGPNSATSPEGERRGRRARLRAPGFSAEFADGVRLGLGGEPVVANSAAEPIGWAASRSLGGNTAKLNGDERPPVGLRDLDGRSPAGDGDPRRRARGRGPLRPMPLRQSGFHSREDDCGAGWYVERREAFAKS